ncbi:hypothetical protein BH23GEM10_BH23GEM10_00350 [soil metagenome]
MQRWRKLVAEVHRRSLWQVLSIYLVGSWVGYELIVNLTQGLGLPDWVPGFAVVLFIIGLPIVLATAFVQEGMPGTGADGRKRRRRRRAARGARASELTPAATADAAAHAATAASVADGAPPEAADDEPALPDHAPPELARRPTPNPMLTWQRSILAGIVAFLLLGLTAGGYMGMRNAGVGPFGSLVASGVLDASERVIVANFNAVGTDSTLAFAVTQAFRVDFAQSDVVTLVDQAHVDEVLQRMDRSGEALSHSLAREVALRDGIKAVLLGEITHAGGRYVLSANLVATETGATLASFRETADDENQIIPTVDRLSKKLRERIGESLRSIRANPRLDAVTTPSIEALRKYSLGVQAYDVDRQHELAITLLNEALAIDPTFAMAWRKLAAVHSSTGSSWNLTVQAATRAYEHRDRLTRRERANAEAFYHMNVTEDWQRAAAAYSALLDAFPEEGRNWNNLGIVYGRQKRYAEALDAYERSLAFDSTRSQPYINIMNPLIALGRRDEAEHNVERFVQRFGDNADAAAMRFWLASLDGDFDGAESHARRVLDQNRSSPLWTARASFGLAAVASVRGRLADAERHTAAGAAANTERGLADAPLNQALTDAQRDLFVRGDPARATRRLDEALGQHPIEQIPLLDRPYLPVAQLYAAAGQPARARTFLNEHERLVAPQNVGEWRPWVLTTTGMIAVVEQRFEEGVRDLRRAADLDFCRLCVLPHLAAAYEAAGMPDSAVATYRRYVDEPAYTRAGTDATYLGPTYERLADLYDQRGDTNNAALFAAKLTELWADADPVLQPRVQAARGRLQQLVGERR